jgi:hypothetical protein
MATPELGGFSMSSKSTGAPSAARDRALSILHPTKPLGVEEFAHYMWPLSPSWRRTSPGRAIRSKAQGFLSRLSREGLVEPRILDPGSTAYVVSQDGIRIASGW